VNPAAPQQGPLPVAAEYPQPWPSMAPEAPSVYPEYPVPGYPEPTFALASVRPEPLPDEPGEYHQFYRAPAFRWWKPLAIVVLFGALYVAALVVFIVIPMVVWYGVLAASGQPAPRDITDFDPTMLFIVNNISIAIGVPIAFLTHWIVSRQRPRWLSSVAGGFRWRPFWRFLAIAGAVLLASES